MWDYFFHLSLLPFPKHTLSLSRAPASAAAMLRRPFLSSSFPKFPFLSSSYSSCKRTPPPPLPPQRPPVPKRIPFSVSTHGRTWDDPYRWMSNTNDPDLLDHLDRENSYAEAFMADTLGLRRRLVDEMRSRMPPTISTPPERWGPWLYYQFIPEGKEYPILCRRLKSRNGFAKALLNYLRDFGKEEILLDWNEILEQFGYVHIGTCRISPDHNFLAYTLDTTGSEIFMLQVKDLRTGHIISNSRVEGVVSLAWSKDSSSLFYTVCDKTQRPYRVFCTKLGSDAPDDLLFTENDLSCCVDITSTKDGKFITVNSNSRTSSEVYVIDANLRDGLWPVRRRVPGVQYFLEHHYGFFYILTNASSGNKQSVAGDYHLARCRAEKSLLSKWQVTIVPGQDITFQDMDIFHGHFVFSLHKEGLPLFCSINMPIHVNHEQPMNFEDLDPWYFPLPSSLCSIVPGSNHDFMSSVYRVVVSSSVMPDVVVDYDMTKRKFTVLHQEEIVGLNENAENINPDPSQIKAENSHSELSPVLSNDDRILRSVDDSQWWSDISEAFACERREVISHDGVTVPMTILYSRRTQCNSPSPGILHGYGAYGEILDKSWSSDHISLLTRGWVLAYADVRGGGGALSWHQDGSRSRKLNSIHDFAACGLYLVNEGYVHKNRLGAIGCSAGGLLVGATINMYPDLFSAAILKVPFLDICNSMLNPSLPLTIMDYEEFGDPRIETEFETIRSYSPYDNICPGVCYPSMLVKASFHDSRVGVWDAAKWVARMRESTCPTCSQSVILKTDMRGGHFSEGGRFLHCEDAAFEYAFLMKAMGVLDDEIKEAI